MQGQEVRDCRASQGGPTLPALSTAMYIYGPSQPHKKAQHPVLAKVQATRVMTVPDSAVYATRVLHLAFLASPRITLCL
jgi:hypothetical protein